VGLAGDDLAAGDSLPMPRPPVAGLPDEGVPDKPGEFRSSCCGGQ